MGYVMGETSVDLDSRLGANSSWGEDGQNSNVGDGNSLLLYIPNTGQPGK